MGLIAYIILFTLDVLAFSKLKELQENISRYDIVVSTFDFPDKEFNLFNSDLVKINELIVRANQGGKKAKKGYDYYLLVKIYDDNELVSELTLRKDNLNPKVIITGNIKKVSFSGYSYDNDQLITDLYYKTVRQ